MTKTFGFKARVVEVVYSQKLKMVTRVIGQIASITNYGQQEPARIILEIHTPENPSIINDQLEQLMSNEYIVTLAAVESKPSWNDAPDRAMWAAQDKNGEWWWYSGKPDAHRNIWSVSEDRCDTLDAEPNPNWRDTLEQRPEWNEQTIVCNHRD